MNGRDTGAAGIDPERVAELLVTPAQPGPGRRGSGYRVSESAVLTAAHVVRDAARVRVRFNADRPGEWLTDGRVDWADPEIDAALVTITARPRDERQVSLAGFGRVAERDAVLACSAMGFPRFKLRDDPAMPLDDGSPSQYRDSVHVVGTIAVLSNRREGTFEVSVGPPERDPDPGRSPWEGMSGAAVWSTGRIIGLVAEHHRADGLGRLAATRVDHWYELLAPEQLDQLRLLLPGLPATWGRLREVVPAAPGELVQAGYTAQVRDIAPEALRGREEELAELVEFCAGEDRYGWWQAGPWAGKSALAAWFVLHPPAGVIAASFFVTGRLAGQADSDAFTEAMIEQLAAIAGESAAGTATAAGRDRERRRLLDLAGERVAERQQRLVLVVDGLDEDEGATAGSGRPSIAALLPKRPPGAVRVLITSRPHPGIPGDVPADHPLRRCQPRRLAPSPFAQEVEVEAKRELLEQLHGDQLQVDVIGFITAAGGGLTLRELAELTGRPEWMLDGKLGSVFGRSLRTRAPTDRPSRDSADRVYLFAHETLRATAEQELAHDLGPYHQRIDRWADEYRAQGWPESTPRYLLRPYGRMLGTSGALDRLISLATDAVRHDRMLAYTYGDASALAEITTTRQLILARPVPDLAALGRLAVYQDRLVNRNRAVPIELPALWARLGQSHRAEALARSIRDPGDQSRALCALAAALAGTDRERALALAAEAEQAARTIPDTGERARALGTVVEGLVAAGLWEQAEQAARAILSTGERAQALSVMAAALAGADRERALALAAEAEQAARALPDTGERAWALRRLVEGLVAAGLWEQAEQAARAIPSTRERAQALSAVVGGLVAAGLWEQAEQAARAIPSIVVRARALSAVAAGLAGADRERALALAAEAEQAARAILSTRERAQALSVVAAALAGADRERALALAAEAEQAARAIPDASEQSRALSVVAAGLVAAGLWEQAEQAARAIPDTGEQSRALSVVAAGLVAAGLWEQAEQAARAIPDTAELAQALSVVAAGLAGADRERALALAAEAEQAARAILDTDERAWALRSLVGRLVAAGLWEQAEQAARAIPDTAELARALSAVAAALAGADRERALALAAEAEQAARAIPSTRDQARALSAVAAGLVAAGLWVQAEQAARAIPDTGELARALSVVAAGLVGADRERALALAAEAEQAARAIPDASEQSRALSVVAAGLAAAGLWEQAEQAARAIPSPGEQDRALSAVATGLVAAGLWGQAERAARAIPDTGERARALGTVVGGLVAAGLWEQAEQAARAIPSIVVRAQALSAVAAGLAGADRERALALAAEAEQAARAIPGTRERAQALSVVAAALVGADRERALALAAEAEQAARAILSTRERAQALSVVAAALVGADRERALALAAEAEQAARAIPGPGEQSRALGMVVGGLVAAGLWDQAERAAGAISDTGEQARALSAVAAGLVAAGLWEQAEQAARAIPDTGDQARALGTVVEGLVAAYLDNSALLTPVSAREQADRGELLRTQALWLVADLLSSQHWFRAIRPLGKLSPVGVVAISEAILTQKFGKG